MRLRRILLVLTGVLAILIHIPGLRTPILLDDYTQQAMSEGRYPSPSGPFGLYDFVNDANRSLLVDRGILPWWSHPKMVMRFMRPLSSALIWFDYRVMGGNAFLAHLHSFLWWAFACLALFLTLRDRFTQRVAWFGVAAYALAPCHAFPLSWIANREEIVSTALGMAALGMYLSWRERRNPRDGVVCLALFSLAVLAGEYTLCFAGYIIAAELAIRDESLPRRVVGIGCFALPALAYLAVHRALHYGAFGIGYYHDPLRDFGEYAASAPRRLTVLFSTAWLGINELAWTDEPTWKLAALSVGAAALLVVPIRRMLGELEASKRVAAQTMLFGSFFSFAPVMAVEPGARLLEVPILGVSAVIGLLVDYGWFPKQQQPRRGAAELTELVVLVLAFIHFLRAPLDTWLFQRSTRVWATAFATHVDDLSHRSHDKPVVTILRANIAQTIFFTPLTVGDVDSRVRSLTLRSGRCILLRTAANSFDLIAAGAAGLFPVGPEDLLRDVPIHQGDRVELPGMRVTMLELKNNLPHRVHFEFDRELEDPSMMWILETGSGFREQKLPGVGYGEPLDM